MSNASVSVRVFQVIFVTIPFTVSVSQTALGQAAYLRDYHWIYGNGTAQLGNDSDSKGFWDVNETGVYYGFQTVSMEGPAPQEAKLTFRSLSMVGPATWNGFCKAESVVDGVDAVGSVGGGVAAKCKFVGSGYGCFMSAWDFDDTTFDYQLKCQIAADSIDHGTTFTVRYGVAEYKHGLKAIYDSFDAEWDLYGWAWTSNGYSWVPLPTKVAELNYDLTGYGGPIAWGQLAVIGNTINLGCTAINFGKVVDGDFRASVIAH